MVRLKKPNPRRCIRAESLKLKGVDYDSPLSFDKSWRFCQLFFVYRVCSDISSVADHSGDYGWNNHHCGISI
jgi:hypothetical protein